MTINKELFTYILDYYPDWGNSPERFLEFIKITVALSRLDNEAKRFENPGVTGSEEELAAIFLKVFKIDLSPYSSFEELRQKNHMPVNIEKVLDRMRLASRREDFLHELLDSSRIAASKETVIEELHAEALIISTINRLRPYLDFK